MMKQRTEPITICKMNYTASGRVYVRSHGRRIYLDAYISRADDQGYKYAPIGDGYYVFWHLYIAPTGDAAIMVPFDRAETFDYVAYNQGWKK